MAPEQFPGSKLPFKFPRRIPTLWADGLRWLKLFNLSLSIPLAPKPAFFGFFMVNNLLFRWPTPLFFMVLVLGAHGRYTSVTPIYTSSYRLKRCQHRWECQAARKEQAKHEAAMEQCDKQSSWAKFLC